MRAGPIVQQRLRTPTGPFFARFFIGIILGLVAEFAFIRPSTRLAALFFAVRWMDRKQIGGLRCQHGCSTGRHVRPPSFWPEPLIISRPGDIWSPGSQSLTGNFEGINRSSRWRLASTQASPQWMPTRRAAQRAASASMSWSGANALL